MPETIATPATNTTMIVRMVLADMTGFDEGKSRSFLIYRRK